MTCEIQLQEIDWNKYLQLSMYFPPITSLREMYIVGIFQEKNESTGVFFFPSQ